MQRRDSASSRKFVEMTQRAPYALDIGTGQGRLSLLGGIRGRVGFERIRDRLNEEILEIILIEHLVDVDCTVDGIPGRVPVGIACRSVNGVRGIGCILAVRVCHRILLHRDIRRIDAEMVVR